jgi:hypothetical protein
MRAVDRGAGEHVALRYVTDRGRVAAEQDVALIPARAVD